MNDFKSWVNGLPNPRHLLGVLLLGLLLTACKSTPSAPPPPAQVTVPHMRGTALQELVALQMRSYNWRLVRKEPRLMVFEHSTGKAYQFWNDMDQSPVMLRTTVTFTDVSNGTLLQATTKRIDTSQQPPTETPVSSTEVQQILEQVRRMAVAT